MKKKFFIIAMIVLVGILATLIVIGIKSSRKNDDTLATSDYPFSYMMKKGNIELKLDGHRTPKLKWETQIQTDGVVQVAQKGSERRGKAKYIISPTTSGTTRVNFVRSLDVAGTKVDVATVTLPIYVTEANGVLNLTFLENPYLIKGPDVIGESSSNPAVINNAAAVSSVNTDNSQDGSAENVSSDTLRGDIFSLTAKETGLLKARTEMPSSLLQMMAERIMQL